MTSHDVVYATARADLFRLAELSLLDRQKRGRKLNVFQAPCIVGAPESELLIGEIVLEALDLIADCTNQTVTPRHPEGPVLALR